MWYEQGFGSVAWMVAAFFGLAGLLAIGSNAIRSRRSRDRDPIERPEGRAGRSATGPPEWLLFCLVTIVPLGSLGIALGATYVLGIVPLIWLAAVAVGWTGIAAGMSLALRGAGPRTLARALLIAVRWYASRRRRDAASKKPVTNPDALDVVGR